MSEAMEPPHGIYPMLYAFFDERGRLDRTAFRRQIEAVLAAGAHGVAILGLMTEVSALSPLERRMLVEWALEDLAGRAPLMATIAGEDLHVVTALAQAAETAGAAMLVFQPPLGARPDEAELAAFFEAAMASVSIPAGPQNAPEFLGVGLSAPAIVALADRCPNFLLMKGEGPVVTVKPFVDAVAGRVAIFNGRGGMELTDNLRAGCAGMVPAPDCADLQIKAYEAWRSGDEARADAHYQKILPYVVFAMQSLAVAIPLGKRMFAMRAGIDNGCACRVVKEAVDPFLVAAMRRWSSRFGRYAPNGETP
jgi:2-keto-3-deoxy-L-arabinonate dehydratase